MDSGLNSDLFKKKKFQIGHVWTVTDNNFWTFFENGSHFWTALTLQLVDGFQHFFFQIGQNSTQSPNILSAARFGLAFSHKSKKGDFLLKTQLSDLTKSIFGEP